MVHFFKLSFSLKKNCDLNCAKLNEFRHLTIFFIFGPLMFSILISLHSELTISKKYNFFAF